MPKNKEFEEYWEKSLLKYLVDDNNPHESDVVTANIEAVFNDAYNMGKEAGQQSERDKHRWIPVTERLPTKKDGDIYEEDSAFKEKYIFVIVKTKKRRIPCKYYIDIKRFVISNVIAWQPLPEV